MGFAPEIVFVLRLALLVFGSKRLRTILGGVVRTKTNFEEV